MSKSGPWYHLAGILGGDYAVLQPKVRGKVAFYAVYSRSYWNMKSGYVGVAKLY